MAPAAAQRPTRQDDPGAPPVSMSTQELADRLNELARISGQPEKYDRWSAVTFARSFDIEFRNGGPGKKRYLTGMDLYRSGLWAALTNSKQLFQALKAAEDES